MIDKLDQNLILELEKDARASNTAISKNTFASERTIRNRLNSLFNRSIIHTTVLMDLNKLGFHFMGIMALQVELKSIREIGLELAKHPNICYVINVTGRFDFLAIIVTKSSREYAGLVENFISKIPGVLRTETFTALTIYKGHDNKLDTSGLVTQVEISEKKDCAAKPVSKMKKVNKNRYR